MTAQDLVLKVFGKRVVISTLCFYISALIGAEISEMKVNFTLLFDISAPIN